MFFSVLWEHLSFSFIGKDDNKILKNIIDQLLVGIDSP